MVPLGSFCVALAFVRQVCAPVVAAPMVIFMPGMSCLGSAPTVFSPRKRAFAATGLAEPADDETGDERMMGHDVGYNWHLFSRLA